MELQLCSDLLISLGGTYRVENKIDRLLCPHFVCDDAVVIEIADHREVKEALSGAYVRNVCYPLLVWPICCKIAIKKIGITMKCFSVLHIPPSPNNRQQTVFIHHFENSFGIVMYSMSVQPDMYSAVAIGTPALNLALADLLGQRQILCRQLYASHIPIVTAA